MRPFLSTLLCGALLGQTPPPVTHHLVQVVIRDAHTMDRLLALNLDLAACTALEIPAKMVDVIATDADIETLRRAGLQYEVAIVEHLQPAEVIGIVMESGTTARKARKSAAINKRSSSSRRRPAPHRHRVGEPVSSTAC